MAKKKPVMVKVAPLSRKAFEELKRFAKPAKAGALLATSRKKKKRVAKKAKRFEIFSSRFDESEKLLTSFTVDSKKEASTIFYRDYVGNPNYAWDRLRLVEVIQERKERTVETSYPEERQKKQ